MNPTHTMWEVPRSSDGGRPETAVSGSATGPSPGKAVPGGLPAGFEIGSRVLGLFVALTLVITPWIVAFNVNDPFLNQRWLTFGLATVSALFLSFLLPFWKPRRGMLPLAFPAMLAWVSLAVSTLNAPFLVSLQQGMLWGSQLLLFVFLRLAWQRRDSHSLLLIIVGSGFLMSLYAVAQWFGLDLVAFQHSPYTAVGPLTNPNFLAAYLMATLLLSLGLLLEHSSQTPRFRLWVGLTIPPQLFALSLTRSEGAWLCLLIGIVLLYSEFWEIRSGRLFRSSPLVGGLVLGMVFLACYGGVSMAVGSYPWETLKSPPFGYFSSITRLLEWKMGFSLFLQNPWTGIGPGGTHYLLTSLRPPLGTMLGLSPFNDDPHSFPLTLASETGFFGLVAWCTLIVAGLGVHGWRRWHFHPQLETGSASAIPPSPTAPANPLTFPTSPRITAIPLLSLLLHSLFNNTLSILPLTNLLLILAALHQASCLRDVRWERRSALLLMLYPGLAILFGIAVWTLQRDAHHLEIALWQGNAALEARKHHDAAESFAVALAIDPQSLHGLHGMAQAQESLGRLAGAQEALARLDHIAPNAFGARYNLSRLLFERRQLLEAHRWAIMHFAANQSPTSYELLGRILLSEGRMNEAEGFYREGVQLIPSWRPEEQQAADQMYLHLAALALDRERHEEADQHLRSLGSPLAQSPQVTYLKGLLAFKSGNASAALSLFEECWQRDPKDPRFANALGFLLTQLNGDLPRAQALLETAYQTYRNQKPPSLANILEVTHSLGMLFWKRGQLDRAQELLTAAALECPLEWRETRERRTRDLRRFHEETGRPLPAKGF